LNRPEQALQRAVVEYLAILERQGRLMFYAIPNGGKRSRVEAAIFKGQGVRAGMPDIGLVLPGGKAAFIELKSPGRPVTKNQVHTIFRLQDHRALCAICDSLEAVQGTLDAWLGPIDRQSAARRVA